MAPFVISITIFSSTSHYLLQLGVHALILICRLHRKCLPKRHTGVFRVSSISMRFLHRTLYNMHI